MRMTSWIITGMLVCVNQTGSIGQEASLMEDSTISAETVIDFSIRAGGPGLPGLTSETRTGTLLRGQTGKVPLVIRTAAPDRWLYLQTFAFGDRVCYGFDGTDGWIQDTKRVLPMDERQVLELTLLLDPQALLRIRNLYPSAEIVGEEIVGDRHAYTILGTSRTGVRTELAFDTETGLLLRAGNMIFEDYREVDGVFRPFRIRIGDTDEETHIQMVMEITETNHGDDPDESMFAIPASPLPLAESPLYKPRTQVQISATAMDACAGSYRHPTQADIMYTVTRRGAHLMLHRTGWSIERELMAATETEYFFRFPGLDFRFLMGDSGRAEQLEIDHGAVVAAREE